MFFSAINSFLSFKHIFDVGKIPEELEAQWSWSAHEHTQGVWLSPHLYGSKSNTFKITVMIPTRLATPFPAEMSLRISILHSDRGFVPSNFLVSLSQSSTFSILWIPASGRIPEREPAVYQV